MAESPPDPIKRFQDEIRDLEKGLDDWTDSVLEYGNSFMTVTGIAVAGVGNTDLYVSHQDIHHILAAYVALGYLAFFILKFFAPWKYLRVALVFLGVWAIFGVLVTTMFHVMKPEWWGWMACSSLLVPERSNCRCEVGSSFLEAEWSKRSDQGC